MAGGPYFVEIWGPMLVGIGILVALCVLVPRIKRQRKEEKRRRMMAEVASRPDVPIEGLTA